MPYHKIRVPKLYKPVYAELLKCSLEIINYNYDFEISKIKNNEHFAIAQPYMTNYYEAKIFEAKLLNVPYIKNGFMKFLTLKHRMPNNAFQVNQILFKKIAPLSSRKENFVIKLAYSNCKHQTIFTGNYKEIPQYFYLIKNDLL